MAKRRPTEFQEVRAFLTWAPILPPLARAFEKKELDCPRQKALAPPEAQVVLWFARLAAGRSTRVPRRGEERETPEGFF